MESQVGGVEEHQRVHALAGLLHDGIAAPDVGELIPVVAPGADQGVVPGQAPREDVVAGVADQRVVALGAGQDVRGPVAHDQVVGVTADDVLDGGHAAEPGRRPRGQIDPDRGVREEGVAERVGAAAAVDPSRAAGQCGPAADEERVIADAADQAVHAVLSVRDAAGAFDHAQAAADVECERDGDGGEVQRVGASAASVTVSAPQPSAKT